MLALVLVGLFVVSRLVRVLSFPPFLDELLYTRWVATISADLNQWLLPLKEFGWAPFTTWVATLINLIAKDPLLSLRLTAALFGGLSLIVVFRLAQTWFKSPLIGYLSLFLILTSPIVLIHDRLGLRGDSAVTLAALLVVYGLSLRLIKNKTRGAYLAGLGLMLGLLTKSTAWLLPGSAILAYFWFRPKLNRHDFWAAALPGLSVIFYLATGSLTSFIGKRQVFLLSVNQALDSIRPNLIQVAWWSWQYLTWPVLLLVLVGAVVAYFNYRPFWKILLVTIIPMLLFVVLFAKILFPRYLLYVFVLSLFFAAVGLEAILKKLSHLLGAVLIAAVFWQPLVTDFVIVTDLKKAPLPEIERWQYVTGWPSGYGLAEVVDYLKTFPPEILITESDDLVKTGLPYLWPDHGMTVVSLADDMVLAPAARQSVLNALENEEEVFLALNVAETVPASLSAELLFQVFRPENKSSIKIFKVISAK
ncbi:MAG: hypothetical protein UX85_C0002G0081 [Candidatus Beckwithbacteria bacterium GW2011_GWB1_47_15]|uniref:Glycosyltransferase RgtA/B/C/D-like domain-containing protein n=1 Tax=Candidatus Beckwithbacteria bacterium GW2011_GWB1_47_15 TaxID=1618371 RepID=A0A0G1RX74_9BACT|nr:MAG: hypothetical protein UY43_C0001G0669 [Candidatus Beckwithbacteria bacterium GW2011_GWC1_49_16]KKU35647.1 MAG: hypothetical protein UX50_C0002G0074 [Candidatus Beckwithbacteria bacterium GW2011_GWA1_46_30]KKU61701.1 MAG: hypothetical protein UX85_C0002G0081 [Candidatus Beckwithbacteria bacterium GW2011_GWB1_47_15]KKU72204.1 MAG: hypothetical protein UX97_C0001G0074 [Candidatus Beckwithbacteria bacterium GW2011_GWA2_47_25]KKW05034.1 MAG: hypothetical protein UY37_C0001G0138 [Candidatus Be